MSSLIILPIATVQSSSNQTLDSHTTAVVTFFVKKPEPILFPDRSQEHAQAVEADRLKEVARLEALRQAEIQIQAQAERSPVVAYGGVGLPPGTEQLKMCEAGGDYTKNTGNGYYGTYQYDKTTWNNFGGYATANLAPPAVQDAKFLETYSRRGKSPWPSCGRFLP